MEDDQFIYLLANPYHIKRNKEKIKNNHINEIFSYLKQKFKKYSVNDTYKQSIITKLENVLFEYTVQSTIDDIIEKVEWNLLNNI